MRLALVQPPPHPRDTPPFELAMLAALLRRLGHRVAVFDLNNELYRETFKGRELWKYPLTGSSLDPQEALPILEGARLARRLGAVLDGKPDAVIVQAGGGYGAAAALARLITERRPGTRVVGTGLQAGDPRTLRAWKEEQDRQDAYGRAVMPFDRLIIGEDELALPAALASLDSGRAGRAARGVRLEGRIIDTTNGPWLEDLDRLPFYDFSDYDLARYADCRTLRLSVSRGCPYRCGFCRDWAAGGPFRVMSARRWLAEYEHQHARHPGVAHFRHYDRLLNGDPAVLEEFCGLLLKRHACPPVAWGGDFAIRPEMTDGLIARLARARCNSFGVGFESGSQRVRAAAGKGFFSNAVAARVLDSCRRHGLPVSLNVMIGLPAETREDLRETIRFIEDNRAAVMEVRLTAPATVLQPGSPFHSSPRRFGLASNHPERWETADGANGHGERVRRFQEFCGRMLDIPGLRLAVNRRVVRSMAAVRRLAAECLEAGEAAGRGIPRQLERKIRLLGPWEHQIELRGLRTRDIHPAPTPPWSSPLDVAPRGRGAAPELRGRTVLDIGCRDGGNALAAAARGAARVVGIDTDVAVLRRADFVKQTLGLSRIDFRRVDPFEMDHWVKHEPGLRGRRFDWALLIDGLNAVPHPVLLLEKAAAAAENLLLSCRVVPAAGGRALHWGPGHQDPVLRRMIWVPDETCLREMLRWVGFGRIEVLAAPAAAKGVGRITLAARRGRRP